MCCKNKYSLFTNKIGGRINRKDCRVVEKVTTERMVTFFVIKIMEERIE